MIASFLPDPQTSASAIRTAGDSYESPLRFLEAKKNPYAKPLKKKQVTLRLDEAVLSYFKELGLKKQLPWQTLVNLYLRNCADEKKEPHIEWHAP